MNNYAIARVFTRIANLMEIKGENVFKIRAYRSAAQAMQELTESLEVLAERGELGTVPGVGDAIAQKTRDILATGTTRLYEKLKEEVPESLVELLDLPGFGPKKVHAAWTELGIRSLDDLEQAVGEKRLQTLPGLGAKTQEKLAETIAAYRKRRERLPIADAIPYAEALLRMMRETGAFERVEVAGSLRRKRDMVADIDLVASSEDLEAAVDVFSGHPEVRQVLQRSAADASVVTHHGVRVDLRVTTPPFFDAMLEYLTGSREHNERLRRLWEEEPDALFAAGGYVAGPPGAQERMIVLPRIPPELREGRGEVEAALEGRLPRLIEEADVRGALHAHTTWSDGAATIERMAAFARSLGHAFLAITDHSRALGITRGLDPERLLAQMAEIDAVNAALPDNSFNSFKVLKGIECDILADGTLDLPLDLLRQLDFVIGSIHVRHSQDEEAMTARIVRALEAGVLDLLAHPTGRILGMRDPYPVDMAWVMDAALANGVALEINGYPDRIDMNEVYARQAMERGIQISINPDAHRPEHLMNWRYGIGQARRAWLEPHHVINTWPLERLTEWRRERRPAVPAGCHGRG